MASLQNLFETIINVTGHIPIQDDMFQIIEAYKKDIEKGEQSDGYHTINELYEHRNNLFIALCREISNNPQYQQGQKSYVWRSKFHSDGSNYEGWFILGIGIEKGEQITYHLPMSMWDKTDFVLYTYDKAPTWDNHTANDVIKRLQNL